MKIITSYPVLVNNNVINRGGSGYSSLDGGSKKDSITAFQQWYNKNIANRQTTLKVDGVWGPKTDSAWKQRGEQYEKQMSGALNSAQNAISGLFGGMTAPSNTPSVKADVPKTNSVGLATPPAASTTTTATTTTTPDTATGNSKEDHGGGRSLSKTGKILIGCGIGLVLILIIYKVTKTKK